MILTCPQCSTRYQADDAKFTPVGRNVRCAKCGHVWFQEPPAVEREPAFEVMPAEPEHPAEPPSPSKPAHVPPADAPMSTVVTPQPEPRSSWPMRAAVIAGWLGLVALILLIGWWAVVYRQDIATLWPQSASLYSSLGLDVNARGIAFEDLDRKFATENGQNVLTVTGTLVNISKRELPVPQVVVILSDKSGRALYHWTFSPNVETLEPGQRAKFTTRLSNPPDGARYADVRFAQAGD